MNDNCRCGGRYRMDHNCRARCGNCSDCPDACTDKIDDVRCQVQTLVSVMSVARMGAECCAADDGDSENDQLFHILFSCVLCNCSHFVNFHLY